MKRFDIQEESRMSVTDKILYNILLEIREMKNYKENKEIEQVKEEFKQVVEAVKEESKYKCKICGTEYNNKFKMMACSKKCKKEAKNK